MSDLNRGDKRLRTPTYVFVKGTSFRALESSVLERKLECNQVIHTTGGNGLYARTSGISHGTQNLFKPIH